MGKSHALDSSETLQRLTQAHDLHESLAETAQSGGAQNSGKDQSEVTAALRAQNSEIGGGDASSTGGGGEDFPELEAPHLVLASPAGIETTTPASTHIASGEHVAITSGKHASVSAGDSILATAKRAVRVFAYETGIRAISALADIDVKALKQSINLLAKLDINITANRITITAKEEVLVNGGGSYTLWKAGQIENGSTGPAVFYTKAMTVLGPRNKPGPTLPSPPTRMELKKESTHNDLEVFLSTFPEAGYAFGNEPYEVYSGGTRFGKGITGPDGRIVIKDHQPGTPAYTIKLTNGAEFNLEVSKRLDPASKEQQLSNEGFRGPSGAEGRSNDYPSIT